MGTYMSVFFCNKDPETGRFEKVGNSEDESTFANSQDYAFYGFLGCKHRNYSATPECANISQLKEEDISHSLGNFYESYYCVPIKTLLDFDWDSQVEDRRCTVKISENSYSGAGTAPEGEGIKTTYKELFSWYYHHLDLLRNSGAEYLVYYFY